MTGTIVPEQLGKLCVSPLLAEFCRLLNDAWDDEGRQRLKPVA